MELAYQTLINFGERLRECSFHNNFQLRFL